MRHPIFCIVLVLVLVTYGAALAQSPLAPSVHEQDQRYLTQVARRTMTQFLDDGSTYTPTYAPPSLAKEPRSCVVTVRRYGELLSAGVSAEAPLLESCRNAAFAAVQTARDVALLESPDLEQICIGLEILGDPIALKLPAAVDTTDPTAIEQFLEPGVDGVALSVGENSRSFLPSEIIYKNVLLSDALLSVCEQLSTRPEQLADLDVRRFRTCQWVEVTPGGEIAELTRGLVPIPESAMTPEYLDGVTHSIAEYMIFRHKSDGWFSYQYEPSPDVYTIDDNLVRQAGAAWALGIYGDRDGHAKAQLASRKTIMHLLEGVRDLPGLKGVACIMPADGNAKAGLSALTCLALLDHRNAQSFHMERDRLVNGLLWLQQEDGRFLTAFPPARKLSSQTYFPGECLLALAKAYEQHPQAKILEAFDRGLEYYRGHFRDEQEAAFVSWQMQAFALMAKQTKRQDFTNFVFEMADWLLPSQVNEENSPYPELYGGIATYRPGRVGVSTATYLEGLTDALELARRMKDGPREKRYERAVRLAARFVVQLQLRPEEAYYVRSPQDAIGGIRTTPTVNLLRIDHCQHALAALMKTRDVLAEADGRAR